MSVAEAALAGLAAYNDSLREQAADLAARSIASRATPGGGDPEGGGEGVGKGPPLVEKLPTTQKPGEEDGLVAVDVANELAVVSAASLSQRELRAEIDRVQRKSFVFAARMKSQRMLEILTSIAENREAKDLARVAAAKTVIEFGYGKAPQRVEGARALSKDELRILAEEIILKRAAVDGGRLLTPVKEGSSDE